MAEKIALITGGLSGIGREVAGILAENTDVYLADIAPGRPLAPLPDRVSFLELDVTEESAWKRVRETLKTGDDRLDYLVLSAGIAPIRSVRDTTSDTADIVMQTNLTSILTGIRVLWDVIVASKTAIVLVSSVAGLVGQNNSAAYVASKGGVIAVTRALAIELAPYAVRVNCVSPGPTETAMLNRHLQTLSSPEHARKRLERRMPIGRLLQPEEVARPIVFLLSEKHASGINGSNLVIDGGLTASFDYGSEFAGSHSDD